MNVSLVEQVYTQQTIIRLSDKDDTSTDDNYILHYAKIDSFLNQVLEQLINTQADGGGMEQVPNRKVVTVRLFIFEKKME